MRVLSFITTFFFVAIGFVTAAPSAKMMARDVVLQVASLVQEITASLNHIDNLDTTTLTSVIEEVTREMSSVSTLLKPLAETDVTDKLTDAIDQLASVLSNSLPNIANVVEDSETEATATTKTFLHAVDNVVDVVDNLGITDVTLGPLTATVQNLLETI